MQRPTRKGHRLPTTFKGHRGNSRYPLPPEFPADTFCVQIEVPDSAEWRRIFFDNLFRLCRWTAYAYDDDRTATEYAQRMLQIFYPVYLGVLENGTNCTSGDTGDSGDDTGDKGICASDYSDIDFADLLWGMRNMKFRLDGKLYSPVIDLIEDCGCGAGTDANGLQRTPPRQLTGSRGSANEFATLCDLVSGGMAQFLANSVDSYIDKLQTLSSPVDVFGGQNLPIYNSIKDSLGLVENELDDSDFLEEIERAFILAWNDPFTNLSREDLRAFAYNIPVVFGGAPMWGAFVLWSQTADLDRINLKAQSLSGQANYSDCEGTFARYGVKPYRPEVAGGGGSTQIEFSGSGQDYIIEFIQVGRGIPTNAGFGFSVGTTKELRVRGAATYVNNLRISPGANWPLPTLRAQNGNFYRTDTAIPSSYTEYAQIEWNNGVAISDRGPMNDIIQNYIEVNFSGDTTIAFTAVDFTAPQPISFFANATSIPAGDGGDIAWVVLVYEK